MFSQKADHAMNGDLGQSYEDMDDDFFEPQALESQGSKKVGEKQKTSSASPKKVQFDDDVAPRAEHARGQQAAPASSVTKQVKVVGQSSAAQRVSEMLASLEQDIDKHYNAGNTEKRNAVLVEYCQTANEAAQNLNLHDENDQKAALRILHKCTQVIDKNSNKLNPFSELYYETYNNMARCANIQGDIQQSLAHLVQAMEHVRELSKEQEPGSVTIIPELSLNICNANIYLKDYQTALHYAEQAIVSSKQCVSSLERKLDLLGASGNASVSEQQRLSQLYLSQLNLNIQGYQAKGQAYEKIKAYQDAIREYNKAKQVVEQNFGTSSKMFIELVNQISAANVNLKTANYSGRSEGQGLFSGGGGSGAARGRAGRGLKKKEKKEEKKKPSPERDTVQSKGSSIDIRSELKDSSELERVSKMSKKSAQTEKAPAGGKVKGSLIFDGDDTGSNKKRTHHAVTAQKRRRIRETIDREQQKANKLLQQSPHHVSRNGPARPFSAHTSLDAPYTLIQPPWNQGGNKKVGCFFNKNTRYCLASTKDLWKVDHQVHPQMLGDIGYSTSNPERPKRLYYQGGRFPRQKSRSRSASTRTKTTIIKHQSPSKKHTDSSKDSQLYEELQKMRNQIKQREMTEIEERIKLVQQQQLDQQKNVLQALEQQKTMMLENHQKERERARAERESLLSKQSTCHESPQRGMNYRCNGIQQEQCHFQQSCQASQYGQQAPPIHPQYGPAVFDYNYGCWTYPYAQWYGGYPQYQQEEESPERERQVPSPPERHERSIQKDFDVAPKPEVHIIATQTPAEAQKATMDFAIQTLTSEVQNAGTSPLKVPTKIEAPRSPPRPRARFTKDQAARIIAERCRKRVLQKREAAYRYRDADGVLLTRKWKHNKLSGGSEIMAMYAVPGPEGRCLCLRFTVFDYASKQFIYVGVYEELKHLQEFDAHILSDLSKSSLDAIAFEKSPFRLHILCLQSIINSYRIANKPQVRVRLEEPKEKKPTKEPEILYIDKEKPKMVETFTQMDEVEETGPLEIIKPEASTIAYGVGQGASLKKPRQGRSKLELIIRVQSRIRAFLARRAFKIYQRGKERARAAAAAQFAKEESERANEAEKNGKVMEPLSKIAKSKELYTLRKKVTCTHGCPTRYYTVRLLKQIAEDGEFRYELKAKEANKKNAAEKTWKIQNGLRLPQPEDDPANNPLLSYYMNVATVLDLRHESGEVPNCELSNVRLLRVNLQGGPIIKEQDPVEIPEYKPFRIGCILKLEFPLHNYPGHWCKVYKRIRMEDPTDRKNKRRVHDWKIKVIQLDGAQSWDYLVVRRLPCKLDHVEQHIQDNLGIQFNKRIIPSIILHLFWDIKISESRRAEDITVFSQTYHDLASSRFHTNFLRNHYMSQNLETQRRVVTARQVENKEWDPLYEIYVQELVPKVTVCKPYRYNTEAYRARKAQVLAKKQKTGASSAVDDADSSSEDEDDPSKYRNTECFWDLDELERMQLDEQTIQRSYIKLTCQKTTNKQDHDHFRVEKSIARWANPEVEYQFLMECLALKQIEDPVSGETTIDFVGLNIRADEARFRSDKAWNHYLRSNRFTESFMAQDQQRWKNQNFAVSVYNMKQYGGQIIFEAINVDKPHQRAYITDIDTLKGMRGQILLYYIDQALKIYAEGEGPSYRKERSSQYGFTGVINSIEFSCDPEKFKKRLAKNPDYENWDYEKSDDELEAERQEPQYIPTVVDIDAGKKSDDDNKKKEEEERRRKEIEKKKAAAVKKRKTDWTYEDQRRAAIVMQKWMKMVIQRRRYRLRQKKSEVQAKFAIKLEISKVKFADLYIIVKRYQNPVHFKFVILNLQNRKRNDDILYIKAMKLPGGLKPNETDVQKFMNVFRQKLKIIWHAPDQKGITRIQDGFIDNTVIREEVIHKIVEVKIHEDKHKHRRSKKPADGPEDLYCQDEQPTVVVQPPPAKPADGDETEETELSVADDELAKIKMDIKDLKTMLKMIKKKATKLEMGIRGWFLQFDRDNSDKIELNEFIQMVKFLQIEISDRLGIMLFRLFDRQNQGFFSYAEFLDIIDKRMRPSYKKYVRMERERYEREGLNIVYPKKKKPQIVYKEKIQIKEVPKEVIKEKIVYVDKPVEKVVEKIVEKPIYVDHGTKQEEKVVYIEKPVEKVVYVDRPVEKIVYKEAPAKPEVVIQPPLPAPAQPAQPLVQPAGTWDDQDNLELKKNLKQEVNGVFNVNNTTDPKEQTLIMYEINSGKNKDYYFNCSTKSIGQNFILFRCSLIGDNYEEAARERLRKKNNYNPTKNAVASELKITIEKELKEMSKMTVNPKWQPERWIPDLKEKIIQAFSK